MHPALAAVIATLAVVVPALLFLLRIGAPFLRAWFKTKLKKDDLERLHAALKGAAIVVSEMASKTPGFTIDDGIAEALAIASREAGAALLEQYGNEAVTYLGTLHADPTLGHIRLGQGLANAGIGRAIRVDGSLPTPLPPRRL